MKTLAAAITAALALLVAAPALADASAGEAWRAVDAETGQIRDVESLKALAEAYPDSGSVRLRLLNAQLGAGDIEGLLDSLAWLKARGYVFSAGAQAQIPSLLGEEHEAAARELLIETPKRIVDSTLYAEVPAEAGLIEGVFADQGSGMLVATSITGNAIHIYEARSSANGEAWTAIAIPGASDLSGIVGEPDRSMGWTASANLDGSEETEPLFTGLMGLRQDFQNPVLVPAPETAKAVSDLTIGPDATVYASDPIGGGIYRKPVGATQLDELVAPGTFRSPQGLALSEDGAHLYVSDYRYGLARIALESGTVSRLSSEVPVLLDGIDGLFRHGRELIAIQNGSSPMRIVALTLSEDGHRITEQRILEQAHPEWTEPLGGAISGNALFYVATGQWDRYEKGESAEGKPPIPTHFRRLELPDLERESGPQDMAEAMLDPVR